MANEQQNSINPMEMLPAMDRVDLTLGKQFRESQVMVDQIRQLRDILADQATKIEAMKPHVPAEELAKIFAASPSV